MMDKKLYNRNQNIKAPQKKESERVAAAGRVVTEILGVPDNIPQALIDKAECAIVLPGVLKFAIGLGGSYGLERLTHYQMLPQMGPPDTTILEFPRGDESWKLEMVEFFEDIRVTIWETTI